MSLAALCDCVPWDGLGQPERMARRNVLLRWASASRGTELAPCFCPKFHRRIARAQSSDMAEHTAPLAIKFRGDFDLGRSAHFKLRVELDRLFAPSELDVNHLVIENFNFRLRGLLREASPIARNSSDHFAILYDLKFGLALFGSKQINPGINLSASDCRGFM